VAGVTIQAHVLPGKLPTSIARMVERGRAPLLSSVAAGAVTSHSPGMNILSLVAADTLFWQLVL